MLVGNASRVPLRVCVCVCHGYAGHMARLDGTTSTAPVLAQPSGGNVGGQANLGVGELHWWRVTVGKGPTVRMGACLPCRDMLWGACCLQALVV